MTDRPTPGAVAYDAYWRVLAAAVPGSIEARWDLANSLHRAAWEAAAQAVLARWGLPPTVLDLSEAVGEVDTEEDTEHA